MKRYIIRHGFTGIKRGDRVDFGPLGPPLDDTGELQAKALGDELRELGVDLAAQPAAVSEMTRTQQTATLAGFKTLNISSVLNEVHTGLATDQLERMLANKTCPTVVIERARKLLETPPMEQVWVTHGMLIMGIYEVLGKERDPYEPGFCEICVLDI